MLVFSEVVIYYKSYKQKKEQLNEYLNSLAIEKLLL